MTFLNITVSMLHARTHARTHVVSTGHFFRFTQIHVPYFYSPELRVLVSIEALHASRSHLILTILQVNVCVCVSVCVCIICLVTLDETVTTNVNTSKAP